MKSVEDRRARVVLALFSILGLLLAATTLHGAYRREMRTRDSAALRAVSRLLPSSDLALSGGARWLRAPSMEEPGAAFADGPALPDPDPAGGVMAPPREVWAAEVRFESRAVADEHATKKTAKEGGAP